MTFFHNIYFFPGTDFRFFSKPYYLRLHLPREVEEAETAGGQYQADIASFVLKCPKKIRGQHFEGLDMLTKLLTPPGKDNLDGKVEELSEDVADEAGAASDEMPEEDDDDIDWYFEQSMPDEKEEKIELLTVSTEDFGYGFNFSKTGVFKNLLDEFGLLLDVKNPDAKSHRERLLERQKMEAASFDSDHYLCDLYETEEINEILAYETDWRKLVSSSADSSINQRNPLLAFSSEEQERLLALPRRTHKMTDKARLPVFFTLLDLLFAQHYDQRINLGEAGSESGWCMSKLSPTLSACTRHSSLQQTVTSSLRRSLVYPLYRHWQLGVQTWRDVLDTLKVGKAAILKSLLHILASFSETEGYYVLNQLYIEDYAVWIQSVPDAHIESLTVALRKVLLAVTKADVDLELEELEHAAKLTLEEQCSQQTNDAKVDEITKALDKKLDIDSDDNTESEDENTDSDDDYSTDSEESSDEDENHKG